MSLLIHQFLILRVLSSVLLSLNFFAIPIVSWRYAKLPFEYGIHVLKCRKAGLLSDYGGAQVSIPQ